MTAQIWFEDFAPGTVLRSPARMVTLDDIDRYAALTGERHPVHMDEAFAREAGFPGRIAHGLFGLALIEALTTRLGDLLADVLDPCLQRLAGYLAVQLAARADTIAAAGARAAARELDPIRAARRIRDTLTGKAN